MKAIFKGKLYHVEDDVGLEWVALSRPGEPDILVDYGNSDLIIDPTDGEVADAD